MKKALEIHPEEILQRDFMRALRISARQPASDVNTPPSRNSELVNVPRLITADAAFYLEIDLPMAPRFWRNLQAEHDVRGPVGRCVRGSRIDFET